jgi:hypothetical protein
LGGSFKIPPGGCHSSILLFDLAFGLNKKLSGVYALEVPVGFGTCLEVNFWSNLLRSWEVLLRKWKEDYLRSREISSVM